MKIKLNPIVVSVSLIILIGGFYYLTRTTISTVQKDKLQNISLPLDSLIFDKREAGNISLKKFTDLVRTFRGIDSTSILTSKNHDSLLFLMPASWVEEKFRKVFYNDREANKWERMYRNLPIRTFEQPQYGFAVKIDSVDHKPYLYLPYEILFSVVKFAYNETGKIPVTPNKVNETPSQITIKPSEADEIISAKKGNLIQTEGIVWKHVSELIAKANLQNSSKIAQLCYLWKYAKDNWVYINDPVTATHEDTWRSASETIETYYFDNTHKYTGDCDDFAILVASFARQVGLESRFIGAYSLERGHAYSEFFVESSEWGNAVNEIHRCFSFNGEVKCKEGLTGNWINLDWWGNHVGGEYYGGIRKIYDL
jgi:hypothetical protein